MDRDSNLTISSSLWHGIVFLSVIFTAIETSFSFAFNTTIQSWQLWVDILIGVIFTIDLIWDIKHNRFPSLKDASLTFIFFMIMNIIACVPFDAVAYLFSIQKEVSVIKMIRLIRLLRLVRIGKILFLIEEFSHVPQLIQIRIYVLIKILIYATIFAVITHWLACIWGIIYPPESGQNLTEYYIKCLYWAVTTITTVGYGDITPTNSLGRFFTMMVMLVGVGLYGFVIGNFSQMFAQNAKRQKDVKKKFHELQLFMNDYRIPERLQNIVFDYYRHILTTRPTDSDQKIISDLPSALRQEVKNHMNMKFISALRIFKNCSFSCIKDVTLALSQEFYSPGEFIVRKNEMGEEMYIIGHGILEVLSEKSQVIAVLHEGGFFGELSLLKKTTRNADVRAKTYCDLYKLSKEDFLHIIKKHPELLSNIRRK